MTIAAIATPSGQGGIGVIRISGNRALEIATKLLGKTPIPRHAYYTAFKDADNHLIDQGILLYFQAPYSFTGEDVVELQTHGSPVILNLLLRHLLNLGAVIALPGQFSERAFLNGKIDLAQAEAIADLISASSDQAALSAARSLQGKFSEHIHALTQRLTQLRVYMEATLDFPEEDIDLLTSQLVKENLQSIQTTLEQVKNSAKQGALLRDGIQVVIAGAPNVGKSSLLNQLSGQDTAIVTNVPGTTRDILREHIYMDGLPLHIIDTAGLRITNDIVEQEGIRRAQKAITQADRVLLVIDTDVLDLPDLSLFFSASPPLEKLTLIRNKIDLYAELPSLKKHASGCWIVSLSAKTGAGLDLLSAHLKDCLGFSQTTEGTFMARQRHLTALDKAEICLKQACLHWENQVSAEFIAEELRLCQTSLSEITGEFLSDDLLGEIFRTFCIGK